MKRFARKALGLVIMAASGPFFIEGGVSRYSYQKILTHPNYWMLIPGGALLLVGALVFGPKQR